MPELPEVETIVRGLSERLVGKRIERVDLLLPKIVRGDPARLTQGLAGARIGGVSRKGKLILIELDQYLLAIHLKMTGRLLFTKPGERPAKHTHLCFIFEDAPFELHFNDLRQFGWLHLLPQDELDSWAVWTEMGPDILELDEERFLERIARHRGRLKPLLLNQSFVAGLGNIYAIESLHRAGLHPLRRAEGLSVNEKRRLFEAIREVLTEAIDLGGSSISNFRDTEGNLGYFQTKHRVYNRQGEACLECGAAIERIKMGGRSTYFCPCCQPLDRD